MGSCNVINPGFQKEDFISSEIEPGILRYQVQEKLGVI